MWNPIFGSSLLAAKYTKNTGPKVRRMKKNLQAWFHFLNFFICKRSSIFLFPEVESGLRNLKIIVVILKIDNSAAFHDHKLNDSADKFITILILRMIYRNIHCSEYYTDRYIGISTRNTPMLQMKYMYK